MIREAVNKVFPISEVSLKEIEKITEYLSYDNDVLFFQKNIFFYFEYILLEGSCECYMNNIEGEEIPLFHYEAGSILSPYVARVFKCSPLLYFRSLSKVKLAKIDTEKFIQLMLVNPEIWEFANEVVKDELRRKIEQDKLGKYLSGL